MKITEEGIVIPDYEMYDAILPVFAKFMRKELAANFKKGDRNGEHGWQKLDNNKFWISELYYHVGKLQSAVMANDIERIKENTADIANIAMMVLDVKIDLLSDVTNNSDWYSPDEMRKYLKSQNYSPEVANELCDMYSKNLNLAYQKGISRK